MWRGIGHKELRGRRNRRTPVVSMSVRVLTLPGALPQWPSRQAATRACEQRLTASGNYVVVIFQVPVTCSKCSLILQCKHAHKIYSFRSANTRRSLLCSKLCTQVKVPPLRGVKNDILLLLQFARVGSVCRVFLFICLFVCCFVCFFFGGGGGVGGNYLLSCCC